MKKDAPFLAASSIEVRNKALEIIAVNLEANKDEIFAENKLLKIAIDYIGDVFPCNLLSGAEYNLGNILKTKTILEEYYDTERYENVKKLKAFENSKCFNCSVKFFCWSCLEEFEKKRNNLNIHYHL